MTKKKLLLVEDEVIVAMNTKLNLEGNNFEVTVAHEGMKAIEAIKNDPSIDLVLMDIDLGSGIDGTETAISILSHRDIPVVFLTSHTEKHIVDKVKGITRYGYVMKSSGEFVLLEAITMAFELYETNKQLCAQKENSVQNATELSFIYEHTPVLLLLLDSDRQVYKANAVAADFSGYSKQNLIGKRSGEALNCIYHLEHPKGCGFSPNCRFCCLRQIVMETFQTGKCHNRVEVILPTAKDEDEMESVFLASTSILTVKKGEFVLVAIEDITELRSIENQFILQREHYRLLHSQTSLMIHSIDEDGVVIDVNEYWLQKMGYDKSEVIGRKSVDFLTDQSKENAVNIFLPKFYDTGFVIDISYQFIKKNGEKLPVLLSAISEKDVHGNFSHSVAILKEVEEKVTTGE